MDAHANPRPVPAVAFLTRSGRLLQMSLSVPDTSKAHVNQAGFHQQGFNLDRRSNKG